MILRRSYLDKIDKGFDAVSVVVLIGARQVGKTSLMKMIKPDCPVLFLNGQDPEISGLFQKLSILESYLGVYLHHELKGMLMIDEFQFIPGVSTMLKLLTDKYETLKILCSGSSGIDIRKNTEESLAGRLRMVEVLPLSFAEYILFRDEKLYNLYSGFDLETCTSALTSPFSELLNEYLTFGGLPRAALTADPDQKMAILDDIYKTYLIRDVRSYIRQEHFIGFNKMLRMLAAQTSNLVNANEISREAGLPYRACEAYLELLQEMYIIKLIPPYSSNRRSTISKMKKVFFIDPGLRNMIHAGFQSIDYRTDNGALFENFVLLELYRNLKPGGTVSFYRTNDGAEVDFVLEHLTARFAIECKFRHLEKPVQSRALTRFCDAEGIGHRFIVNRNLNASSGEVKYVQGFLAGLINR